MAGTEDKLSMSLDAMIAKSSKGANQGSGPKRTGAGGRGGGAKEGGAGGGRRKSAGDARARVLSVPRGGGTAKRSGAPRRASGGSAGSFLRRDIEVGIEERREDPNRPRIDTASMAKVRAALDGNGKWEHDLYEGPRRSKAGGGARAHAESGFKLLITNLDFKVTDEDVQELFKEFGPVKRANVVYDRSGRSEEQAEVVYLNRAHALAALKKYNRVCLDGKPMHIELVSQPAAGGRVVEALSSGIRISRNGGGDNARTVSVGRVGSGNMRSAQGGRGNRRAPTRLGGRGRQAMDED